MRRRMSSPLPIKAITSTIAIEFVSSPGPALTEKRIVWVDLSANEVRIIANDTFPSVASISCIQKTYKQL